MNINGATNIPTGTNFKGIIPKKVCLNKLANSFSLGFQRNLTNNFNLLEKSKAVDVVMKENGNTYSNAIIMTRKPFMTSHGEIPAGSKIELHAGSNCSAKVENGKFKIDVIVNDNRAAKEDLLILDFGNNETAQKALNTLTATPGKAYVNDVPIVAMLMDLANRAQEPIQKLSSIFGQLSK